MGYLVSKWVVSPHVYKWVVHPKKNNIEPENDGLEDEFPLPWGVFSGSMLIFRGVSARFLGKGAYSGIKSLDGKIHLMFDGIFWEKFGFSMANFC